VNLWIFNIFNTFDIFALPNPPHKSLSRLDGRGVGVRAVSRVY
jgi:hypothetical protein